MLSHIDTDKKRTRRTNEARDEPEIVFGVTRRGQTEIELWEYDGGKWHLAKEDVYAVIERKIRDKLYTRIFLRD